MKEKKLLIICLVAVFTLIASNILQHIQLIAMKDEVKSAYYMASQASANAANAASHASSAANNAEEASSYASDASSYARYAYDAAFGNQCSICPGW